MEKIKENINAFKNSCADCLLKAGLNDLRGYGRSIGMRAATKLKKSRFDQRDRRRTLWRNCTEPDKARSSREKLLR